jgi:ketosteroid isomerase-like protein
MTRLMIVSLLAFASTQPATPQSVVDELLAADRTFALASTKTTVIPALTAMFADDVVMPIAIPKPGFARGKSQAAGALEGNPANAHGRLEWAPVRGGISADGQHGFTVGYMTATGSDGKTQAVKYVAYWVKGTEGWRVAVYKRVPADQPPSSREMMVPALPDRLVPAMSDAATIARHQASLAAAEKAFSDDAQKIGLGPAFARHGSADAINVGPRASGNFVVGSEAIGRTVGAGSEGKPSPVAWAADGGTIVASSGDLGVTFGYIRQNTAPPAGQPGAVPFVTIWRRPDLNRPWRYVAE